jgi:TPR repeat protein
VTTRPNRSAPGAAILLCAVVLAVGCTGSQPASTAAPTATQSAGRCRGTLGIEAVPISRELRKKLALPKSLEGVAVSEVLPGGPAAAAGLRPGDVVENIGGRTIENDCDFVEVAYNRTCEPVRIVVRRAGQTVEADLVPVDQDAYLDKECRENVAAACFREGWIRWKRRSADGGRALELFDAACKGGSAEGCAYQGLELMDRGDGTAVPVLERSCKLESAAGCANLAFLFATGKLVKKDDRRATSLYAKACDLGDEQGCYNVGLMADEGRGGAADVPRAVASYDEACALGSSTACTNLGYLYEHGRGVKTDAKRAVALYQRGCDGTSCQPSNLGGCLNVGRAYRDGIGVAKSEPRAASIFREACDRKPNPDDIHSDENGARACSLLGALYLAGDGVDQDLPQARELSDLGCERGDSFGCFNAAAIYTSGSGVAKDATKAAFYLDRACKGGDGEGCYDLGVAYEKGNGVTKDASRARELFKKSCELGYAQACPGKRR